MRSTAIARGAGTARRGTHHIVASLRPCTQTPPCEFPSHVTAIADGPRQAHAAYSASVSVVLALAGVASTRVAQPARHGDRNASPSAAHTKCEKARSHAHALQHDSAVAAEVCKGAGGSGSAASRVGAHAEERKKSGWAAGGGGAGCAKVAFSAGPEAGESAGYAALTPATWRGRGEGEGEGVGVRARDNQTIGEVWGRG